MDVQGHNSGRAKKDSGYWEVQKEAEPPGGSIHMEPFDPLHCPVTGFLDTVLQLEKLRFIKTKYLIM